MKEVHAMTQNDEEGDDEPGSDNQKQQLIAHLDQAVNAVALEIRKFVMNYKEKEKERFASFRKTPSASATPLPTTPKKSEEPQSQIITDVNKRHTVKNLTEFLPHRPSKTELIERKILHPEKKPQPTTSSALRPTIVAKKQPPLPPGAPASPSIGLQRSPSTDGSPMPRTASSDGTASPSSVIRADAGRSPSVLNYGTLRGMGANRSSRASVDVSADASDTFMLKGELVRLKVGNVYFKHRDQGHVTWKRGRLIITNFQLLFTSDANRVLVSVSLGSISTVQKLGGKTGDALQDLAGNAAYKIIVELKNFQKIHFNFERDKVQKSRKQVYETLKSLGELPPEKCFAFSFKETYRVNGWDVYMPEKEYERMGISLNPLPGQLWRLTYANRQYRLCDTYPYLLCVPMSIYDTELISIASYRSRARLPVLTWLHPKTMASITRCSQPRVGIRMKRSAEDEKMIEQILAANPNAKTLEIVDARPKANARANIAKGAGTEMIGNYPNCKLTFHDIGNIHVMRDSLSKLSDVCGSDDWTFEGEKWLSSVESTGWLNHIAKIMSAVLKIIDFVDRKKISVLVHCSDGWDRTPQLTSLSCMMMDKYYRTMNGFEVLIEKEWVGFGHQFALRTGHDGLNKSSERSPVFIQFMDCVYQLMCQYPTEFEFNEKFLMTIIDECYSCRFGSLLFDSEKRRKDAGVRERTNSMWSYINSNEPDFINPLFRGGSDETIYPVVSMKKIRIWEKYHFRHLPELNTENSPEEAAQTMLKEYQTKIKSLEEELARLKRK
eukprot:TRINITY_DN3751_c0_g1_i6.p1 TRINITY_DN3751_c0_g1~~TRINITY_DN3751_c0_g1_i6.p1  ORF type:complete len:870 (-),score=268.92 TRINITY_DN3751_c0_g1_i6:8-2347(-)